MARTLNQLDPAAEPVLGTDQIIISRDGNVLTKTVLSKLPISTATQNAINNIVVLTPAQVTAGAVAVVGITSTGVVLDAAGIPIKPYSRLVELTTDYTLQPTDMNVIFQARISVNITIPTGLGAIACYFYPPSGGSLTFTPTGGTTINDLATAQTRSSANQAVNLLPTLDTDKFKLTGI